MRRSLPGSIFNIQRLEGMREQFPVLWIEKVLGRTFGREMVMNSHDDSRRDQDARIRERAYEIWVSEGRPEGRHSEHWEQAHRELSGDETRVRPRPSKGGEPKPAHAKTVAQKQKKTAPKSSKPRAAPRSVGTERKSKSPAGTD